VGQQLQHFTLPSGEVANGRRWRDGIVVAVPGELLDDRAGHGGREQRFTAGDDADRGGDLFGRGVLEHEPASTGAQGIEDVLVQPERRQDKNAGAGLRLDDPPRGFDPVQHGHPDVHQDYVRPDPTCLAHGVFAVHCFADNHGVLLGFQNLPQAHPDECLVVCDQHAGHRIGSWTRTANPPLGRLLASNRPPQRATRSRIPTSPWPLPDSCASDPAPVSVISRSSASAS